MPETAEATETVEKTSKKPETMEKMGVEEMSEEAKIFSLVYIIFQPKTFTAHFRIDISLRIGMRWCSNF